MCEGRINNLDVLSRRRAPLRAARASVRRGVNASFRVSSLPVFRQTIFENMKGKLRRQERTCSVLWAAALVLLWLTGIHFRPASIPNSTAMRWNIMLPPTNSQADYCTQRDADSLKWLVEVYRLQFLELHGYCPLSTRVGPEGDGGKIVCAQHLNPETCVIYSLGSRLDFSFEVDIRNQTGCSVFTFDCTVGNVDETEIPEGVNFHPWCVGAKEEKKVISSDLGHTGEFGQYLSLQNIMTKLGHKKVDLLKMDIERHEVSVIESMHPQYSPEQIVFETHLHNAYGIWNRPMTHTEWRKMWNKLQMLGYRIFSYEPNPGCPCCCEWSIRK